MQQTSYRKPATRKPQTPQEQLKNAIERAARDQIAVAGSGRMTDGRSFWLVPSQSVAGMMHVVSSHGKHLECDCFYDRMQHKVCVHRAAVYLFLLAEDKLRQEAASAAVNQGAVENCAPVVAKPQPVAPARASTPVKPAPTVAQRGDAALPADPTPTGFSIFADTPRERRYQTLEDEALARDGYARDYASHEYR